MRRILLSVALLASVCLLHGADSTEYQRVQARLRDQMEPRKADGSREMNKQFRRWEWFWQGRLQEDGTFPTSQMYKREYDRIEATKLSDNVQAQKVWKELGPTAPDLPIGSSSWYGIGRVNVVEVSRQNPDLLYAGSASGGLWKSTNAGQNWTAMTVSVVPVVGVSDIAVSATNDQVMYVATGDANGSFAGDFARYNSFSYGVIKTTNGGATWSQTKLSYGASEQRLVCRLWVDPRDANVVVAATYGGMFRTVDGGESWTRPTEGAFRDLIGSPVTLDVLYATTYSSAGGARIFRSKDAGKIWEEVFNIPRANRIRLAVTKANGNVVAAVASDYATQGLEGVYKSDDGGTSFRELPTNLNLLNWSANGSNLTSGTFTGQGFYDLAMEISPTNANHMYVGGINIWRTTNNGLTWILSAYQAGGSGASLVHADQHYFKFHPSRNVLYSAHDGGIARTTDVGFTWRDISNGLRIQQYYGIATSDINPSLMISGSQDNGTVMSKNGGTSFTKTLDGDGMMAAIDYIDPQIMYASRYNGDFSRSSNQGNNWIFSLSPSQKGDRGAWVSPVATDPKSSNVAYIGYQQIYKSTSAGAVWTRISQITTSVPSRSISVSPSNPNYIYVGYDNALWYTTDGGAQWLQQSGISGFIMSLDVHPKDPKKCFVAVGGFSGGQKVLQISNGVVSNITGAGLPNVPCNTVVSQEGVQNRIFAGTDLGVFVSYDGSGFWEQYGSGMPAVAVTMMKLIKPSGMLRVSTYGRGSWEIDSKQCSATTPIVTALSPTTQCAGDSVVLEASAGFDVYRWTNGDTTRRIVLKAVSQTGAYAVSVEDNSGCRALSAPISVTILIAPVKPAISKRGRDTLRSSAVGGITDFQWLRNGSTIAGATLRELFTQTTGTYTVRVKNTQGCTSTSSAFAFVFDPNSIAEDISVSGAITIRPNPSSEIALISMPLATLRTIDVISLTGQTVFSSSISNGASEFSLNCSPLARGAYIVRVSAGASVWMARLVRE